MSYCVRLFRYMHDSVLVRDCYLPVPPVAGMFLRYDDEGTVHKVESVTISVDFLSRLHPGYIKPSILVSMCPELDRKSDGLIEKGWRLYEEGKDF